MINPQLLHIINNEQKRLLNQSGAKLRNEIATAQAFADERERTIRAKSEKATDFANHISPLLERIFEVFPKASIDQKAFLNNEIKIAIDEPQALKAIPALLLDYPIKTTKDNTATSPSYEIDIKNKHVTGLSWNAELHNFKASTIHIAFKTPIPVNIEYHKPYAAIIDLPAVLGHNAWSIDRRDGVIVVEQDPSLEKSYNQLYKEYAQEAEKSKTDQALFDVLQKYHATPLTPIQTYKFRSLCTFAGNNTVTLDEVKHVFALVEHAGNVIALRSDDPAKAADQVFERQAIHAKKLTHSENTLVNIGIAKSFSTFTPETFYAMFEELREIAQPRKTPELSATV